ncbi:hypothetical protein [Rhizobium sp. PL01]|uniref:hypothetical protein n=1 Tax=Rhizobium sp. PL01 TaxID=3085631 RepID=UPI002980B2BA|nr:hypothetical protein [Rhizobium sp. PL01]MDW5316780.1 hypothetical protein [Rhizobium sp. PL01]
MAGINMVKKADQFSSPSQQLMWDRVGGTAAGAQIAEDDPVRNRPHLYAANGAPVTINRVGPVTRLRINGVMIDVNFATGECALMAKYPPGASQPNNTPLTLTFDAPVLGIGGYLSILGDQQLYDGRGLHGVMWVLLTGDPEWKLAYGDGITGPALVAGSVPTAPFVGAEATGAARIQSVCFDASLAGNFDRLVLSRIYWTA